ncbi:MAG TPA: glycosyltransferase family 39 protein, partial [Anaerolineales bacterium]|nr:glycosyltransferase family 39 protein [Anaerolineales bacterium]
MVTASQPTPMILLAFLPALTLAIFTLARYQSNEDLAASVVDSTLGLAAYAVLVTEALSLVHGISRSVLLLAWCTPAVAGAVWVARCWRRNGSLHVPRPRAPKGGVARLAAAGVGLVAVVTAVIAWFAPPNTWDALTYQMSRVAHWAQNGSIGHYASGIEAQNFMPPGALILVLQTYVLGQSDRLANFVQWFAMIVCLVVAARLAGRLGAGETGRWAAALFAATLPTGITQATAVTTDYVIALWVAIAALAAVEIWQGTAGPSAVVRLGLASGLAFATKQTAAAYLAPFLLLVAFAVARSPVRNRLWRWTLLALLLATLLGGPFLARDMATYGNPAGPSSRVDSQTNQVFGVNVLVSNLLRNATLHLGTPSPYVNKAMALAVRQVHAVIGLDENDPRTT